MIAAFPILGQSSASPKPGEGALDDPAFRQDDEAVCRIGSLDDLEVHLPQNGPQSGLESGALISAIGIELEKEGVEAEQGGHHKHAAITILDVGGMNDGVHQQAFGVDENVPLLALNLLARIVARRVDARPPFSALLTLWLSMIAALGEASRSALSRHSM